MVMVAVEGIKWSVLNNGSGDVDVHACAHMHTNAMNYSEQ